MKKRIFVVDDEQRLRSSLRELLESNGHKVDESEDGNTALKALQGKKGKPDLILLDVCLPDIDGMQLLDKFKEVVPEIPVIILTGYGTVAQSVDAMRKGAVDYILKPFNINELILRIDKALDNCQLKEQVGYLSEQLYADVDNSYVVGPNKSMKKVYDRVEIIAKSHATTVLICGETGTGKELIARRVHKLSERREKPFVAVNATALTEELLESELFGHEQGAFTGAMKNKKGLFEVADGGTLFLDEIGDMNLSMQAKILRALEERSIRRVGGTEQISVDIRFIAATNRKLDEAVKAGEFREDLYYRLNVVPILLPPLCDRSDDVESLVRHFVDVFNKEFGRHIKEISKEALNALKQYSWPGNVRELRNLIERTMLLECDGDVLDLEHLRFDGTAKKVTNQTDKNDIRIGDTISLEVVERGHIEGVLQASGGNKNQAAQILGIDRTTLYNKLRKYQLS